MPLYGGVAAAPAPQYMALTDTVVTNTAAETSALPGTFLGSKTIPANRLSVGTTVQIAGGGIYSVPAVTPGTATVKIKLGSVVLATAVAGSLVGGVSNAAFQFDCSLICRTTGATGTVAVVGGLNFATTAGGRVFFDLLNGGANAVVDTTAPQVIDITVTWDTAVATKTITVRGAIVTYLA